MDYNKFSEDLRSAANVYHERFPNFPDVIATYINAANAIETLLAERDAAIEFLKSSKNRCASCVYNYHSIYDYPCKHCKETGGMSDYWDWRGLQKD